MPLPEPPRPLLSGLALRGIAIAPGIEPLYLDGSDWALSSVDDPLIPQVTGSVFVPAELRRPWVASQPTSSARGGRDAGNAPGRAWRYTKWFRTPHTTAAGTLLLVFGGVKKLEACEDRRFSRGV